MRTHKLIYVAKPGEVKLAPFDDEDPLANTEPVPLTVEGYAIPQHINGYGETVRQGFDITDIRLARSVTFANSVASIYLPQDHHLHWKSCPEAIQWANEQVPYVYRQTHEH